MIVDGALVAEPISEEPRRRTAPRLLGAALRGAAGAILLVPLAPPAALAQELACADCHEVTVAAASPHAALACADCHANVAADEDGAMHQEAPLAELSGPALCAQCHDAGETLATSVHAVVGCADCHGKAHGVLPASDLASAVSPVGQIKTCAACHPRAEEPGDLVDGYLAGVHAKALLVSGLIAAPSCSTCHGSHDILRAENAGARVAHGNSPETCGSCHVLILDRWRASAHGELWQQEASVGAAASGPVCVTCHASHRVEPPRDPGARLATPESCGGCHGEAYASYRDSFHGKASDLGFLTAATCTDCHTPHENLPAADPRASIHPANLEATCGRCHGAVSASFVSFDPHADPSDPARHRGLHWIWLFMTSLLVGVFGFFGVHDALWLQRSLVALGREGRPPATDEVWVRRFSPLQIGLHVVVMVTFLVLAATGLPLKFHVAPWAEPLAALFGGVGTTAVLHRLAAVLTFGYFLVHLATLFHQAVVRREPGLFWGWRSMVPRGKDFADLWQQLRWFLYRGPRPQLDRWAYWEKFDYFAVFWGVLIIGCSGLVLWFPRFFASFLPGWALNAAYVVHSDEALLAVGFIFVFHFLHTHLRPEVFPLDPVIFTGSMPLARFREERPVEHQRLVEHGRLEALLVAPPTPAQLRRARLVGGTGLVLGLLLAIGLLFALLAHW